MSVEELRRHHHAAIRAGKAGDLRALVSIAGGIARRVRLGAELPPEVKWVWDPTPIVGGEEHPPLALCGPTLVALANDPKRHADVHRWLANCLVSAYEGDWGSLDLEDRKANEESLKEGSRLMCVYPWLGDKDGQRDFWVFIEAAHGEDVRFRRVTCLHRDDY